VKTEEMISVAFSEKTTVQASVYTADIDVDCYISFVYLYPVLRLLVGLR